MHLLFVLLFAALEFTSYAWEGTTWNFSSGDDQTLSDGDHITLQETCGSIFHPTGVPKDHVRIGLWVGQSITWWKAINKFSSDGTFLNEAVAIQDSPGIIKYDDVLISDLSAYQWVLSKAKFLGVHTDMYKITNAADMKEGCVYTWQWLKDSAAMVQEQELIAKDPERITTQDQLLGWEKDQWDFKSILPQCKTLSDCKLSPILCDKICLERDCNQQVPSGHVRFGLYEDHTWWKAITVHSENGSFLYELVSVQDAPGEKKFADVSTMDLSKNRYVLSKAKFLGVHTDMYEIANAAEMQEGCAYTWHWECDEAVVLDTKSVLV